MKKNILIGIVVVFALALVASAAMAWNPGYGRGEGYGPGYGNPPIPNLTPEQATKIQTIQQATFKEIAPLQQQLFAKKTELRGLWLSQTPDQAKINALQKDILNISAQLQEKTTNARFEMRKALTPEQQAQLTAYGPGMGYGMGRMGGRMGRW
ncbi:MAG: Spy/CpxP family protein refolding chaperone [Proteobacteria bacterium]|nr:Spy/CpxP family protein refolding chaperone [Pseudomonadota bacterium]